MGANSKDKSLFPVFCRRTGFLVKRQRSPAHTYWPHLACFKKHSLSTCIAEQSVCKWSSEIVTCRYIQHPWTWQKPSLCDLTVLGRRHLIGKLKRKTVTYNSETGFPFIEDWMYMASWTRWQQSIFGEGFPSRLECTWKRLTWRMILLLLFKEKTGSVE